MLIALKGMLNYSCKVLSKSITHILYFSSFVFSKADFVILILAKMWRYFFSKAVMDLKIYGEFILNVENFQIQQF